MNHSSLDEELEAIKAIYVDELTFHEEPDGTKEVQIIIHPSTAEKVDQQYVCITLILKLSKEYPNEAPKILIKNPRGLSDEELYVIKKDLTLKAERSQGSEMLYQLIELGKEYLTAGNSPSCECSICLYDFKEADVFLKTECYHYFHSYCLASYAVQQDDQPGSIKTILCPVCRAEMSYEVPKSKDEFPPPVEELNDPAKVNGLLLREQQKAFSEIYAKQMANGGIIDVEAEKSKYFLNISFPSQGNQPVAKPENSSETACEVMPPNANERSAAGNKRNPQSSVKLYNSQKRNSHSRSKVHNSTSLKSKTEMSKSSDHVQHVNQTSATFIRSNCVSADSHTGDAQIAADSGDGCSEKRRAYKEPHFRRRDFDRSHQVASSSKQGRMKNEHIDKHNPLLSNQSRFVKHYSSNSKSDSVGGEFCLRNCHTNVDTSSDETHTKREPYNETHFTKRQNLSRGPKRNFLANCEPMKNGEYDKRCFAESRNQKTFQDRVSQNLSSRTDRNVKLHPKRDPHHELCRKPVYHARKAQAARTNESQSSIGAKLNTSKKTCDVTNHISPSAVTDSDQISTLTASFNELTSKPSLSGPPGFQSKQRNNTVRPPPGFTSS